MATSSTFRWSCSAFNLLVFFSLLFSLLETAAALSIDRRAASAAMAGRAEQIFQYDDGTFIENISILPDGRLLLAALKVPHLLVLDPEAAAPTPKPVVTLPGVTSLAALTPMGNGLYAVTGGNHTSFSFDEGSMKVYVVALETTLGKEGDVKGAVINTIPVPNTSMLNGLASLPGKRHIVFSHDSIGGRLFRIDTSTNTVTIASTDPAFGRGGNNDVPLGANGIKIQGCHLYFTNSAQGVFYRVALNDDGYPVGEFDKVAQLDGPITLGNAYDDFTFDTAGNAYVTLHPATLMKITKDGKQTIFGGGNSSSIFHHPTSAVLAEGGDAIYVSTGGDWENGASNAGQVIKVSLGP